MTKGHAMNRRLRWIIPTTVLLTVVPAVAQTSRPRVSLERVELVTVADTAAVFTWETDAPADAVVRYGTRPDQLDQSASSGRASERFHYCEVRGLRPGTEYHYRCESNGSAAPPTSASPGRFTTLVPPGGEKLLAFATLTDTHVGEQQVGRVVLPGNKVVSAGLRWREPAVPFWELALAAAVEDINARTVTFTVIKGDVTHGESERGFPPAKRLLDRLKQPYRIVRGNHDRPNSLRRVFNLERLWYSFDQAAVHFVVLDTEAFAGRAGTTLDRQLAWLADDLTTHREQRTFVFVHRPVPPWLARDDRTGLANAVSELKEAAAAKLFGPGAARVLRKASGRDPCIPEANARRLAGLLSRHGRIAGVFAGHLHRNYVGFWPEQTGNLPYVESASAKEYPCGYTVTQVYRDGYMHNFYPVSDPRALEWSAMTRALFTRLGWEDKAGSLADRSFVVEYKNLDLTPAPAAGGNK